MYYDYYLVPNPGFTIKEACEIATEREALIAEHKGGEATGVFFLASQHNKSRLHPKFPTEYYTRKQKIIQRTGISIIEKPLFEEKLAAGHPPVNPFFQLILIAISRSENPSQGILGLTEPEIIRYLVEEVRVFPDTHTTIYKIQGLLDIMSKESLILQKGDYWARGITLKGGDMMVDWKQGYDPVEYHLLKFIKDTGLTSREECHKYIMNYLGWISRRSIINDYLKGLIQKRCVSVQNNNWFVYKGPLSPFKSRKKL